MGRLLSMFLVLAFAVVAFASPLTTSVANLASAIAARISVLQSTSPLNKLQKKELKGLEKTAEQMLLYPDTGALRDLIFLASLGKPLKSSGTRDAGIQSAVVGVANCMLEFVQDEVQSANAAVLLLQDPKNRAKMDKALAKVNKAFQTTQQLFNTNPGAAIQALMDAAVEYRKIRNKAQDLLDAETP